MSYTSGLGTTIDVRPMNPDGSCPAGMSRIAGGGNSCFTDPSAFGPPPAARPPAARLAQQQIPPSIAPSIAPSPPVSAWRQQVATMFDSLGRLSPQVRGEGDALRQTLTDPTKTDREAADRLKAFSDRYRSIKPTLPEPAVRVIDPVIDGAINLVPPDVRPAGLAPVPPSFFDDVPWVWVAGSFIAGLFASTLFTSKKTTPNRRRRRYR